MRDHFACVNNEEPLLSYICSPRHGEQNATKFNAEGAVNTIAIPTLKVSVVRTMPQSVDEAQL